LSLGEVNLLNESGEDPEQALLEITTREKPESIKHLVDLAKARLSIGEAEALKHVVALINQDRIKLEPPPKSVAETLFAYTLSNEAYWFWTTIVLALVTPVTVFTVPEDAYPLVYIRYVLGGIFIFWLPGYTFIKALFPTTVPIKTSSENLDTIIRIALSAGMSLALVLIVGLLLNYTPWGIRLTPITLSLLALTLVLAGVALGREYKENKYKSWRPRASVLYTEQQTRWAA
jgi:hypothetical protein